MSLQVELKKSAVSQKLPLPSDLALGEIALNYNADGPFLTCKDTAGNIRKLNRVWVGATAPSSPTTGDPWLDNSGSTALLRIYDGSTWTVAVNVPLATTSAYGTVQLATSADITNGTAGKIVDAAQLQSKITTELSATPITFQQVQVVGNTTIGGNLTVNGTTTTIDTVNLVVKDKNIEMGVVDTPTDTTADGGGVTLKGATDKTLNWSNATDSWTSSENVDLASGKSYRINGTEVLSATALGSAVQISSANIPSGTIVDSDVNAAAEIAVSKLADGAARQLLQTDAAGTGVEWTSNVDVPGTLDVSSTATFDSIASHPLGSAGAPTITFTGDTNTGIYSPGADQVAISTNGTGRLHITSDGKVGISTPLPAGNFGVNGSSFFGNQSSTGTTGGVLRVNPSTSSIYLQTGTNTSTGSSAALVFSNINAANEWMRITSDGKLGLGTSAPATALEVAGAGTIRGSASGDNTYPQYQLRRTGSTTFTDRNWTTFIASNGNFQIKDESAGLDRLIITTGGNVGVGTTSPDLRITVQEDNPGGCINLLSNDGNGGGRIGTTGEATTSNGLLLNANRGSGSIQFQTSSLERARIDSSGKLLVGTSSAIANVTDIQTGNNSTPVLQTAKDNWTAGPFFSSWTSNSGAYYSPQLTLGRSGSNTIGSYSAIPSSQVFGTVAFSGDDGDQFLIGASIQGVLDGGPANGDMPGRLVFSTTADGASSPTERMRIKNTGAIRYVTAFTVATLPAGEVGDLARVTDANAPAVGSTVAGGGAANALCWYNGTNWTVMGV